MRGHEAELSRGLRVATAGDDDRQVLDCFGRYFEAAGEVRKAISVLKKRSGAHEQAIREFRIRVGGLKVGEPLHSFQGVLRGVPEYLGNDGPLLGRTSAGDPQPA